MANVRYKKIEKVVSKLMENKKVNGYYKLDNGVIVHREFYPNSEIQLHFADKLQIGIFSKFLGTDIDGGILPPKVKLRTLKDGDNFLTEDGLGTKGQLCEDIDDKFCGSMNKGGKIDHYHCAFGPGCGMIHKDCEVQKVVYFRTNDRDIGEG